MKSSAIFICFMLLGCSAGDKTSTRQTPTPAAQTEACPADVCGPFKYETPEDLIYLSNSLKNDWNLLLLEKSQELKLNLKKFVIGNSNKNLLPTLSIPNLLAVTTSFRFVHDQSYLIAPQIPEAAPINDWILQQLQHQAEIEKKQKKYEHLGVRSGSAFDFASTVSKLALPFCVLTLDSAAQTTLPDQTFCYTGVKNFSPKSGAQVDGFVSSGSASVQCYNVRNSLELSTLFAGLMQTQIKPYTSCFK